MWICLLVRPIGATPHLFQVFSPFCSIFHSLHSPPPQWDGPVYSGSHVFFSFWISDEDGGRYGWTEPPEPRRRGGGKRWLHDGYCGRMVVVVVVAAVFICDIVDCGLRVAACAGRMSAPAAVVRHIHIHVLVLFSFSFVSFP